MFGFIRSLIAEVLPQQPKPRQFKRRSLLDRPRATAPREEELRNVGFGRRGRGESAPRRKR